MSATKIEKNSMKMGILPFVNVKKMGPITLQIFENLISMLNF
jgi:hypothetical protein